MVDGIVRIHITPHLAGTGWPANLCEVRAEPAWLESAYSALLYAETLDSQSAI